MKVKVTLNGLDQLESILKDANAKLEELYETYEKISTAVHSLELEINQPTAGTDG